MTAAEMHKTRVNEGDNITEPVGIGNDAGGSRYWRLQVARSMKWYVPLLMTLVLVAAVVVRAQDPIVAPRTPPPAPEQPLPYSHRQHIELGLECADCHVNPDEGALMTFPATDTCMSCHEAMPSGTPALKRLATLAASERPIPWVRVYRLAEYVYWSHATHIGVGVACTTCHGPVADRDVIALETLITTKRGCVTCHESRQVYMDCGDCHEPRQ